MELLLSINKPSFIGFENDCAALIIYFHGGDRT